MFEPNMMRSSFPLLAVFLVSFCFAQPPASPGATQAVLAGRLIDVRSGDVRNHAYIVIDGDRVKSITDNAPAGIPVIDLSAYNTSSTYQQKIFGTMPLHNNG